VEVADAKRILFEASRLRVPNIREAKAGEGVVRHTRQDEKIHLLETYAVDAARWRSHLEEARLWMDEVVHRLNNEWIKVEGWEANLPEGKKPKDATKEVIAEAKRKTRPDLFDALDEARHVSRQLSAQVRRIEKDEERVSRIYTFIVGA
jgi:hypothetical protein